ncbi:MAG: TIGR03790 family protein, partial [Planctomycetota bacterium]
MLALKQIILPSFLFAFLFCRTFIGQENVVVVVNSNSIESMTLANKFIELRNIPPNNVIYLNKITWMKPPEIPGTIYSQNLKNEILRPIFRTMQERRIDKQIDCIAYSCEIPYRVDLRPEMKKNLKSRGRDYEPQKHAVWGSLTGATYLHQRLSSSPPDVFSSRTNSYAHNTFNSPSRSFSSQSSWASSGGITENKSDGERYILSTMLAYTGPGGSTIEQAVDQLERSASSDFSKPDGTFYFAKHKDIRSKIRHSQIDSAKKQLQQLGYKVIVDDSKWPTNLSPVAGATLGSPVVKWADSKSQFAPGAICDNLTSYGAMWNKKNQTQLTDYLNQGAAGASGTVYEPYALTWKFPSALTQVHYARGCNLAEAFYQTVANPFQLLIVGDPVCQPFADKIQFELKNLIPYSRYSKDFNVELAAQTDDENWRFEIYLDGLFWSAIPQNRKIKIPVKDLRRGFHEIRVVSKKAGLVEHRRSKAYPFYTGEQKDQIMLESAESSFNLSKKVNLKVDTNGQAFKIRHNFRDIPYSNHPTKSGFIQIAPKQFGLGTCHLKAHTAKSSSAPVKIR